MAECQVCGAAVEADEHECPACGASLHGATASFEPVTEEENLASGTSENVDGPVLIVRKGPQPGEKFFIDRPRLTIGRDPESDVFLNDMTVSRTHAVVEFASGTVSVKDAGSLNGTYVNGAIVDEADLAEGDVVQIGTFQMLFVAGS
jgi:pSer/pThr/pTyr-binding forkhead associated (FHA) protein